MGKYKKLIAVLLFTFLINICLEAASFTINKTVQQPTCGSNGLISFSLTPPPSNGAKFYVYRDGAFLVLINGNIANLNSLAPGAYKVVVIDNLTGEKDSMDNIVLDPAVNGLSATYYIDSPKCDTSKNGRLAINLTNAAYPIFSYSWKKDGVVFTNNDSIVKPALKGKYSVTVTDKNNCRFELNDMEVTEIKGGMVATDTIVFNTSCDSPNGYITIKVEGRHEPSFKWLNKDSFHMPLDTLKAGYYSVIWTDTLKCYPLRIDSIQVKQNPAPEIFVVGTDTLCDKPDTLYGKLQVYFKKGDSVNCTYLWNNGETTKYVENEFIKSGDYTVIVTDLAGCKDTGTWTIQAYPEKKIKIIPEYKEVLKLTQQFLRIDSPGGLYDIVWASDPIKKFTVTTNKDSVIQTNSMTENTLYKVHVKYGHNCETDANVLIKVIDRNDVIKDENIPNIFTPGKLPNHLYHLRDLDNTNGTTKLFSVFEFKVYDRWGNLVYNADNENFEWNGLNINGDVLSNGVYTYIMKYSTIAQNLDIITRTGTILLER